MEYWSVGFEDHYFTTPVLIIASFLPKLLQKSEIVLEKQPNIVNTVFKHGNSLHAHAKREAGNFFGIVTHETENLRIDHAGAKDFQPPGGFANSTYVSVRESAASPTDHTLDIDLGAGLGKRKKARAKPHPCLVAEYLAQEMSQHAF